MSPSSTSTTQAYSTSTTQPYADFSQSSSIAQPTQQAVSQYVIPLSNTAPLAPTEARGWNDWLIMGVGMILTGIIGYFSSIMAVKSDIATNRQDIAIVKLSVDHLNSELDRTEQGLNIIEQDFKEVNELKRKNEILSIRISSVEKLTGSKQYE
ncbi:hypothetical protein ACVBIL_05710 [Shewanella sp. 125m-7]